MKEHTNLSISNKHANLIILIIKELNINKMFEINNGNVEIIVILLHIH
jgi:hypothetical protein